MRYIDKHKFEEAAEAINWAEIKQTHNTVIRQLSPSERKAYIKNHPDWNLLQPAMLKLSFNKCWYSEANIGNGDFVVDHFRPKNRAKIKINYRDPNSKTKVIKTNGYWWKAYDWDNYRISGALSNIRRSDRLCKSETVKGKGDYFPIDLINGRIAEDEEHTGCEIPLLLDPLNYFDVGLLTFDNGIPIPATEDDFEMERVYQSIYYYHLDLDQLNTERKIVWNNCVVHMKDAKDAIINSQTLAEKYRMTNKCYEELAKLIDPEINSFTSTAKACLMVYCELEEFKWLKNFVRTL